MSESVLPTVARRRRFRAPLIIAAGLLATLTLAFSTSGVLAGFTASITNSANSVGSGTLLMKENQTTTNCLSSTAGTVSTANAGTCSTINKYNGSIVAVPGVALTSTMTITNIGTIAAPTFTLLPGTCSAAANAGSTASGTGTATFCTKVDVTINNNTTGKCVFPASTTAACGAPTNTNTLATLATGGLITLPALAAGASTDFTFTVMVDNTATNDHQGLTAAQTLQWSFAG